MAKLKYSRLSGGIFYYELDGHPIMDYRTDEIEWSPTPGWIILDKLVVRVF